MAKILSAVKANRNLAIRFMAAKSNYTTLVAPPDHLNLPREYPFILANFNNNRATAKAKASPKTTTKWTPPNPVQIMGFSTSTTDQIQNEDSSSVPSTSGNANPCLDLFLNPPKGYVYNPLNAEACRKRIEQLLPLAWSHNPLTTLKLVCHIVLHKSIGKYYDSQTFHMVTHWLHQNHPKTLACSVPSIAGLFVSFHQFYNLLKLHLVKKVENQCELEGLPLTVVGREHDIEGQEARQQKLKAVERYEHDPEYRFLHELISDIFAECLKFDIGKLKQSTNDDAKYRLELTKAAASFLSMGSNFSDPTMLRESIARKVFPRESYPEYQGVEEADYTDSVLERLKNEVLLPLEKAQEESLWDPPSCAVEKYLGEVKAGKSKIAADALLPHEIISFSNHWNFGQVAELQWKAMVEDIKKQGKKCKILNNCLAVCDARSESYFEMYEMDVAMALTLLISELNEDPWKGKVINFSMSPQLHLIQGDELRYKCDFLMKRMHCDNTVDLKKVLDLILEEAVNGNLKPEQMIKKVFVFTYYKTCEVDYEAIQSRFKEKGYENAVPQIVLWKVGSSEPKEWVKPSKQPGMTILEDVSDNLIKVLLAADTEICQELSMEATISSENYEKLVVVD